MTRTARLIFLAMILSSCGDRAVNAAPHQSSRSEPPAHQSPPSYKDLEVLERRLDAATAALDSSLNSPWPIEAAIVLIRRASFVWRQRLENCASDSCRRAILTEQLARVDYAQGLADFPAARLPWRRGSLHIELEDGSVTGGIQIVPLIDDRLIIEAGTIQVPEGRWMCDMLAEGRVVSDGTIEMRTLDEQQSRFRLRREVEGRLSLTAIGPYENHLCGGLGGIEGTYRVRVYHGSVGEAASIVEIGSALRSGTARLSK